MRFNSLQFGKAMSAALFVLLLSVAGLKNALGQHMVATLQHEGEISCFYGANALYYAHEAAETGDIITLSGGNFSATDITKAITLRGVGFIPDTIPESLATIITGNIAADLTNDTASLTIEGIRFDNFYYGNLYNPRFVKCYFESFEYSGNNYEGMINAQFVNCRIKFLYDSGSNANFVNSIIWNCRCNITARNSYVNMNYSYGGYTVSVSNCIVCGNSVSVNSIAMNCINIGGALNNAQQVDCYYFNNYSGVFVYFTGPNNYSFNYIYEELLLKEEVANECLGDDGTQVGIYGGFAPYKDRPNYMVLKRCNVATQTTIDNKLSVEIEVVTEGE